MEAVTEKPKKKKCSTKDKNPEFSKTAEILDTIKDDILSESQSANNFSKQQSEHSESCSTALMCETPETTITYTNDNINLNEENREDSEHFESCNSSVLLNFRISDIEPSLKNILDFTAQNDNVGNAEQSNTPNAKNYGKIETNIVMTQNGLENGNNSSIHESAVKNHTNLEDIVTKKPNIDSASIDKFLDMNKQILKTIKDVNFISEEVNKTTNAPLKEEHHQMNKIKPYTEQQLSALYHNSELDTLDEFCSNFVEAELKGLAVKQHSLHELLSNYLKVREKITGNNLELAQLRKEYKELQNELWTVESAVVNGRGECQDGQIVIATHSYSKSIFHRSVFQSVIRILGNIRKLLYENHTLYSYSAEDLRLQIDLFIQSVIFNCLSVTQVNKNSPVLISMQAEPDHLRPYIGEVRLCISVLFAFQRKLIRDCQFLKETREWLRELVAVLLRLANYQDHLFLINHILRCPAGVGSWGSNFIQLPLDGVRAESPFACYEINHLLTMLATILMPIKEREVFLKDIAHNKDGTTEALWVLVDSEGEEDEENAGTSLRENDLVALVNQLPLDDLFRRILLVSLRDNKDIYEGSLITEHHLLRFLAFSTILIKLFHRGLQTYNQPRYNQFSKRLSRLIRHVVQYTTDQWEQFLKVHHLSDTAMLERLQTEYDAFFLRAIFFLYSSQKMGAWQFLAVVPYSLVTIKTLWKIFYFLHNSDRRAEEILNPLDGEDYSKKMWDKELREQFEEKIDKLEDAEVYYLLNTFANMALARSDGDMCFISTAVMDLLQVGFISETTQESCSKSSRILLTHLTSKHPHLLSSVLKTVKENLDRINSYAIYLYEELPLTIWKVEEADLDLIKGLLLNNPITSDESRVARMILSRLNWNLLLHELHCETAISILRAIEIEPGYLQWGWAMVLRLKLHISDKHFKEFGRVEEPERFEVLSKGLRDGQPLASFVALLMTTWGHLVPLICRKGLDQLVFLQTQQKHEAVLFALYQIVPLFLNSQECIINCDKFQEILLNLLNADRGYISYAKSFIITQNTVLQQFGNMIQTQIVYYAYYDLPSPRSLVRLWMNSLVSIPNWNKDNGILYLLDVLIRNAFFHKDALEVIHDILMNLHQCGTPQESTSIINVFKWVSTSTSSNSLISNSLASYPWLAYIFLDIEHSEREVKTGFWRELLIELSKQKGKINVDHAIKKAAATVKISPFTSGWLCIYRWAQQALDTPVDHPLLPLIWQQFFTLYLSRIPRTTSVADKICVGSRFFDGLVNFAFQKKIKKRLQDTIDYYRMELESINDELDDMEKINLFKSCHKVFLAFQLWLEEPRLQESNLLLPCLPPQYEPNLVAFIIQGDKAPWFQYLDYEKLKKDRSMSIKTWKIANFREKTNANKPMPNPGANVESSDPLERILRRLTSYDKPKPSPDLVNKAPIMPIVDFGSKESMFKTLEPCFKTLKQFAHNHTLKISEHKALDFSYQELMPQLYRSVLNKVKKTIPCKGKNQTVHCSGAAVIILEMQEARVNERIEHQIQTNRDAFQSLIERSLEAPSINLYSASVTVQHCVKILQSQLKCNPATAELGVELFYRILSLFNEETTSYLPTRTLFAICLEKLGQSHIYGVEYEMPGLLQRILKEPDLSCYLAPHFSPSNVGTASMLLMYSTICKEVGQKYDIAFTLLSKFEVDKWLNGKNPKLSQRSKFIESVISALSVLGFDPPIEAFMLHGLYRKHLLTVFEFQFPEHYGEVFMHLLKVSNGNAETNLIAKSVWLDILNSLSRPASINPKLPLREQLRQYAQHQNLLQHQELLETAELLSRHFTQERLQYGLYGLYPKCRNYMDIFAFLLGMTGHGLIVSMLNTHQGLLGDKLCEKIWPYLRDLFAPWLVPYSMQNLKENMASWIQQLADDRSILLPWIPSDTGLAQKVINVFFECVSFILHTLPASSSILSYLWQWYVSSFAHSSVKDHILLPVHQVFSMFPWHNFWPSVYDLEFMLKVVDQYLPDCHSFLGHVFMSVPWANWLNNFATSPPQVKARVYHCFLNLVVKLINEPNVRKNNAEKMKSLLIQAENFDWSHLEIVGYQHVMDWMVMSFDSSIIFKRDSLDLDPRLLHFLKTVASYHKSCPGTQSNLNKRTIFVKTYIKFLSIYVSRHKNSIASIQNQIYSAILNHLNDMELVITDQEETNVLLNELLSIVNIGDISDTALKAFLKWVQNKPSDGIVIKSLVKCAGLAVNDVKCLAELYEGVLTCYFSNAVGNGQDPTWQELSDITTVQPSKQTELEQVLFDSGYILTLNTLLLQRIKKRTVDKEALLSSCIEWVEKIKINENSEPKLSLLWFNILQLALDYCDRDEATAGVLLYKFSKILLQISEVKGGLGWGRGLLSAIGITQNGSVSINFRFLCRALAGYILAQLPDMKGEPQTVRRKENAPFRVGQPGGNTECSKVLMVLDFGQSQGKIKECAELALKKIQDPFNSLHNAKSFLWLLLKQFYIKPYLKDIG